VLIAYALPNVRHEHMAIAAKPMSLFFIALSLGGMLRNRQISRGRGGGG
jgi:hypothetical protein